MGERKTDYGGNADDFKPIGNWNSARILAPLVISL